MIWWGIKYKGVLIDYTIRNRRKDSIQEIKMDYNRPWSYLRKEGYSVVKLSVSEVG